MKFKPDPQFEYEHNHCGCAVWSDSRYGYMINTSRRDPDNSSDQIRAKVNVTLSILNKDDGSVIASKQFGAEVYSDNLADWIEECIDEGDFEDRFAALKRKADKIVATMVPA